MKLKEDEPLGDTYIIECTGAQAYANNGFIGINPDLELSEGYDGNFNKLGCYGKDFTQEEKNEIANHMIALWTKWKNSK